MWQLASLHKQGAKRWLWGGLTSIMLSFSLIMHSKKSLNLITENLLETQTSLTCVFSFPILLLLLGMHLT